MTNLDWSSSNLGKLRRWNWVASPQVHLALSTLASGFLTEQEMGGLFEGMGSLDDILREVSSGLTLLA